MDDELETIESGGEYLGITTNNQAEYQAVKTGLTEAIKYSPKNIEFRIDSLLVVNQMKGLYKIKNRDLWPVNSSIKQLIEDTDTEVIFVHVKRELNKQADQKVNDVLDMQVKQRSKTS
jgi:ribonuclease HI